MLVRNSFKAINIEKKLKFISDKIIFSVVCIIIVYKLYFENHLTIVR